MARVLRHIGEHLDEPLSLDDLADVAAFSKFHFHRQFRSYTGMTVARFVRSLRLKRASLRLAFDLDHQIIAIALEAGFASPESFARAFRALQGQTPSAFRASPAWERWTREFRFPPEAHASRGEPPVQPTIVDFEETLVAVLEHRGPADRLMASVAEFIAWRKSCDDSPEATSRTFGVPWGDPEAMEPEEFRFDICGAVTRPVRPNDHGVVTKAIPGGRCAVVRHHGSTDAISETVYALYRDWLPESGESPRDFPCFFHYIERMPRVSEHQQVTDVYLPIR